MKLTVISVNKSRPSWAIDQFNDYSKRFNNSIELKWKHLEPSKNGKSSTKDQVKKNGKKILSSIQKGSLVISLDQRGTNWTTDHLKNEFEKWTSSTKEVSFLIGGQEGLSGECLEASNNIWSLSNLTLPHLMVPVIVGEQIYRVWSMTQNHPYHR